jgi:hypothetical protein
MVLARNTYRFSVLLVGYAIAYEIGAGAAVFGLGLGGVALLFGTVVHYVDGPDDPDGSESTGGEEGGDDGQGTDE